MGSPRRCGCKMRPSCSSIGSRSNIRLNEMCGPSRNPSTWVYSTATERPVGSSPRCAGDPVIGRAEGALVDGDMIDDVQAVDLDARVGEDDIPAAIELVRGTFLTAHPAWRSKTMWSASTSVDPSRLWASNVSVPLLKGLTSYGLRHRDPFSRRRTPHRRNREVPRQWGLAPIPLRTGGEYELVDHYRCRADSTQHGVCDTGNRLRAPAAATGRPWRTGASGRAARPEA